MRIHIEICRATRSEGLRLSPEPEPVPDLTVMLAPYLATGEKHR